MNTYYVKNPKSEPTDKPFPTPEEIRYLLLKIEGSPWHPTEDQLKHERTLLTIYTALHEAYVAIAIQRDNWKDMYLKRAKILDELQQQLDAANKALQDLTRQIQDEAGFVENANLQQQLKNRDSKLLALAHEQNKLQQQLAEANKRIAELEGNTVRKKSIPYDYKEACDDMAEVLDPDTYCPLRKHKVMKVYHAPDTDLNVENDDWIIVYRCEYCNEEVTP